jgi:hypothetical protein
VRVIELKDLPSDGRFEPQVSYRDVLLVLCTTAPTRSGGYSLEEISLAVSIRDKLVDTENGTLSLTDPEYEFLRSRLTQHRWSLASRNILQFAADVLGCNVPASREQKEKDDGQQ